MDITKPVGAPQSGPIPKKPKNVSDIKGYLDAHWNVPLDNTLQRMKAIDRAFGFPSKSLSAIFVAGSNGKSLTAHFTAKLLVHEGLKVGLYLSPHLLLYKERFVIDSKVIANKLFTELANEVISVAEEARIQAHTSEILAMIAFLYFKQNNVDVVVLEVAQEEASCDPVMLVQSSLATITRVSGKQSDATEEDILKQVARFATIVRPGMHLISADQSKATLNELHRITLEQGGTWAMPVRKLAVLRYPYEQIHGRCAALADRLARHYIEHHADPKKVDLSQSLLHQKHGKRGRPTLAHKRQQELAPRKTIEDYWKTLDADLAGKFQMLDKEKPTILLDTANNLDAINNLLLGLRLYLYKHSLKGLAIIMGAARDTVYGDAFLKDMRYFFKKTPGQIFVCPLGEDTIPGTGETISWQPEQVANGFKAMKIKARPCASFAEAFESAKKSVDERYGLVVITGSNSIVEQYWSYKDIKKLPL